MNKRTAVIIGILLVIYILINLLSDLYVDYTWFTANNGAAVFKTLYFTRYGVHAAFGLLFFLLYYINFGLLRLLGGSGRIFSSNILDRLQIPVIGSPRRAMGLIMFIIVIVMAFIMGGAASVYWKELLMFLNQQPFSHLPADPIFQNDIGFYVFALPFYSFLYKWLMSSFVMITIFSILFHVLNGGITLSSGKLKMSLFSRGHISVLLAFIVILHGVSYRISAYDLLYSKIGKFYGAGYTAINASLVAYNVAMILSFIAGALLLFNLIKRSFVLPLIVLAALLPAYFILGTLYPSIQQRFIVEPNELEKEKPYITHNIKFTRMAYGINKIKTLPFANDGKLTYQDLKKNKGTLENVRLWDWRPLKQTYKQLQELKPYYYFNDVDVDRYIIDSRKIAVNLSARELSIRNLSVNSQTWQNLHLIYTHGYGIVVSRVDRITTDGLPELLIKDIPPRGSINVPVTRPELYYGEHNNSYVVTGTTMEPGEFDYPSGDNNKYTRYQGTGGVKLDSFLRRLLFASSFNDVNLLITGNITSESRILFNRNIVAMVKKIAPFLELDPDPYVVIEDGKIYWILDAYTTTDRFPYSTPIKLKSGELNYIRNSVKIVIDAYNGSMKFYKSDKNDPVLKVYENIFSGLFTPLDAMPESLKRHIRYPEAIFNIQSELLLRYHMTDPTVFYNNEDAWHVPRQIYEGNEERIQSYYMVTRLPNEKQDEFVLFLPFTPYKKNNMIGFLAAKCDIPAYGDLQLYLLPKDKLTYGPLQIEARIDQDPDISKQLTLWSQKGSKVIRGNMLAIPVEKSILYIEPLYLKAESSEMPELKRVIVAFNDRIVMESNLPAALEKMFYGKTESTIPDSGLPASLKELSSRALNHYRQAVKAMKNGDWTLYGQELERLQETLERMNQSNTQ